MRTRIGLSRAVLDGVAELAKTLDLSPEEVILGLVAEELPETLAVTAAAAFDGRRIGGAAPPPGAGPGAAQGVGVGNQAAERILSPGAVIDGASGNDRPA